jgi:hypothetical protein
MLNEATTCVAELTVNHHLRAVVCDMLPWQPLHAMECILRYLLRLDQLRSKTLSVQLLNYVTSRVASIPRPYLAVPAMAHRNYCISIGASSN